MICETPDFMFPMKADIFYPTISQNAYGSVEKEWIHDRTIASNFATAGADWAQEVKPNRAIVESSVLLGRAKTDIRLSARASKNAITNIIITNIRDKNDNEIYMETSGPRTGKSTIFEVATVEPFVGPFGSTEYYKIVIRRSENQAATL
jgi:hypothetical protein